MKVLLIEDDETKSREITSHLTSKGVLPKDILRAKNMTDFVGMLPNDIGMFIIDFNLPSVDNGAIDKNGRAILESIIKAGKQDALLLAISAHPGDFPDLRDFYESKGCILADYSNVQGWKSTLNHLIIQLKKNPRLDFLIFCALKEERDPYAYLLRGKQVIRNGYDFFDISLGGKSGAVVLMPKMGLVDAAITASICIDRFKPTVVGMSGICGGFDPRAALGQLFVSTMAYEYQSGKWASDGFKEEPYQVPTDHMTLTGLKALLATPDLISVLEKGFKGGQRPSSPQVPMPGIFTSGSAVIADLEILKGVELTHRKVNALDMEIFAIHRAAELAINKPPCICAKTVVDLCQTGKNDDLHKYGSYISAKFMIKAIENFFL